MSVVSSDSFKEASQVNQWEIPPSNTAFINEDHQEDKSIRKKKKKKSGPFGFFRAALVVLRSSDKNKKKKSSEAPTTKPVIPLGGGNINGEPTNDSDNWKKIVGSMRPLHLQQDMMIQSPPHSFPPPSPSSVSVTDESYHHHHQSPFHQRFAPSPSHSHSSAGTMSQYASASNLQALLDDLEGVEEDPDVVFDAISGDDMIDSKAEEFIAQFYNQMKIDHRHHYNPQHRRAQSTLQF